MSEKPQLPRQPLYLISKIIALLISSVLYSGLLMTVYFVGCQGYNPFVDDSQVEVDFVKNARRTLEPTKKGGNEPEKPQEKVEEIIPPRPVAPSLIARAINKVPSWAQAAK